VDASRSGKDTSGARKPILSASATRDKRRAMGYGLLMIKSFRHKGLEAFHRSGSKAGIQPDHAANAGLVDGLGRSGSCRADECAGMVITPTDRQLRRILVSACEWKLASDLSV